jgi:hypothetical protein
MCRLKTVSLRNYNSQQYQHDAELDQLVLLLEYPIIFSGKPAL